jgi:hypothetical protein
MKEIRSLEIWFINNTYYLRAFSITEVGLGTAKGNPIHIVKEIELDKLSRVILETLSECQFGIPHPDYRIKQENKMLTTIGIKSNKELMKKGKSLDIYLKENKLEFHPMYFDGEAMTSSADRYMYSSLHTEDITKTVLEAFERCHP